MSTRRHVLLALVLMVIASGGAAYQASAAMVESLTRTQPAVAAAAAANCPSRQRSKNLNPKNPAPNAANRAKPARIGRSPAR